MAGARFFLTPTLDNSRMKGTPEMVRNLNSNVTIEGDNGQQVTVAAGTPETPELAAKITNPAAWDGPADPAPEPATPPPDPASEPATPPPDADTEPDDAPTVSDDLDVDGDGDVDADDIAALTGNTAEDLGQIVAEMTPSETMDWAKAAVDPAAKLARVKAAHRYETSLLETRNPEYLSKLTAFIAANDTE